MRKIDQIPTDMLESFEKKRQKCRNPSGFPMDFGEEDRKIGVAVIDFSDDILLSLEKDIHLNAVYANGLSI